MMHAGVGVAAAGTHVASDFADVTLPDEWCDSEYLRMGTVCVFAVNIASARDETIDIAAKLRMHI